MACVYKRPDSPFWVAYFRGADGIWIRKSTKERNRGRALAVCLDWDKAARLAGGNNLTAAQARRILAEMVQFSSGEALTSYTPASWFEEWLQGKKGGASDSTMVRYEQVTRDFLEHLGRRAKTSLAAVTPGDIIAFRNKLREGGRAASTCNMVVKKVLSVPFERARRLGYIPTNPCHGVDVLKDRVEAKQGAKEPFTPEELARLIGAAEGDWRGAVIAGATTGLRLGDIVDLTWGQIDLDEKLVRCEMTRKTGADVTLPLHPDFEDWLEEQTKGIGRARVFPSFADRKIGGRNGLSQQFVELMGAAGIANKAAKAKGKAGRSRLKKTFHSLRHTFISNLANAGVDAEIRQKLAGHSDERVHKNYTHHEIETLRGAVGKLPSLRKAKG